MKKINKLIPFANLASWRASLAKSKKIVITNGCFDILHLGHSKYLEQARELGHFLLVGINDDEGVRLLNKGPNRPINKQDDRAGLLAALECVDGVCIFSGSTATDFLKESQPNVYVKAGDYTIETLNKEELAVLKKCGAQINILPYHANYSTTNIIKKISK
jgi:rfaE bifunctional protein nucleotidyltransferase chain/domain